uniref:Uncharacterized protein n=1 Tax=Picea sitchensis TaxID=3332 RepID=A9P0F4_PICSI|nr:unknown [Picea sitchensis]
MVRVTDCSWQWALLWSQLGAEAAIGGRVLGSLARVFYFWCNSVFFLPKLSSCFRGLVSGCVLVFKAGDLL